MPALEAAEIHRRVIAAGGPALLFTNVKGAAFPLVTNLFGTARRAELAFGDAAASAHQAASCTWPRRMLPPTPAKLWGARDVGGELLKVGTRRQRSGPVTEVVTSRRAARPAAGADVLARRRRPVRHAAARLHAASRRQAGHNLGMYRLHVHDTRDDRHALADRQGRRLPLRAAPRHADEALPVTVFLGGPPALILVGHRAAARERAGADAGVADCRRAAAAGGRSERPPASARGQRRVRADGRGAAARAPARRTVRRSLRLLLAAARLPGVRRPADRPPPRRDLSGHRRRQAAPGGLLHRRPAAGAAVAAVPAGDAGGGAAVVVRRDRLSLAGRRRRQAALQARGHGQRLPHPRRRAAVADEVPAPDRSATWT